MQRRNRVIFTLSIVIFIISLIALGSSGSSAHSKKTEPTCCKKSGKACSESEKNAPGDLMMESLSRQFISIFPVY